MDNATFFGGLEQTVHAALETNDASRKEALGQANQQQVVSSLVTRLHESKATTRREAMEALLKLRYSVAAQPIILLALPAACQDSDTDVRRKAVRIIADMGADASRSPGMAERLISATGDTDTQVCTWAVVALGPIARDPMVRQRLRALAYEDLSQEPAVQAEAEAILLETRTLSEKVADLLKASVESIEARLKAPPTGGFAAQLSPGLSFKDPETREDYDDEASGVLNEASQGEIYYRIRRELKTGRRELVLSTRMTDFYNSVVLVALRDTKLERIAGDASAGRETPPVLLYVFLSHEGNSAEGRLRLADGIGEPTRIVKVETEDIAPEYTECLMSWMRKQVEDYPEAQQGWDAWIARLAALDTKKTTGSTTNET